MRFIKKTALVALALILVLSPISTAFLSSGPTGTAEADTSSGTVITPQFFQIGSDYDEYDASGDYQDKAEAFNDAQEAKSYISTSLTQAENSVHDAENQGWMEAETAFFEAYQDGDNYTTAKNKGLDAMQSHYSTRQKNLIEMQNNFILDMYTIKNESKSFSVPGSGMEYKIHTYQEYPSIQVKMKDITSPEDPAEIMSIEFNDYELKPYTLIDGTDKDAWYFVLNEGDPLGWNHDGSKWVPADFNSANMTYMQIDEESSMDGTTGDAHWNLFDGDSTIYIGDTDQVIDYQPRGQIDRIYANLYPDDYPETSAETAGVTDPARWSELMTDYETQYDNQSSAFETWANGTWTELEDPDSEITASDMLNRLTQMNDYALKLDDPENATFDEGVIALASMGLSSPDADTAYMNVSYTTEFGGQERTADGMLMSHEAPESGWTTGMRYNTTNLPGTQIFVKFDGSQEVVKGDLEINGVYDSNGSVIDDANLSSPDRSYSATNLTDLRSDILEMSDRIATLEETDSTAVAGASTAPSLPALPDWIPGEGDAKWATVFGVLIAGYLVLDLLRN